jgi:hypothetical protein
VDHGSTTFVASWFAPSERLVVLNRDPRQTFGRPATVRVVPRHHPRLERKIAVEARYDCEFRGDFMGSAGTDGRDGADGIDARDEDKCCGGSCK